MDFTPSPRAQDFSLRVRAFIEEHVAPVETEHLQAILAKNHGSDWRKWEASPLLEQLKAKARAAGLWNLFLPDGERGAGLSNVDYASVAEETGKSVLAPEVFNCSAPDTGNMEVLWKYGSPEQKAKWLEPLLNGEIRSTFCMTEPEVASSDAINIRATVAVEGADVVLNGRKWFLSGIGDPRCKILIFLGLSDPSAPRHQQHSMVLVPKDTRGVNIQRMMSVFGDYHEPGGHGEVVFENVRVPQSNIILGLGRGFEIAQGRLGPGRIHHAMRCIGAAEKALEMLITRGSTRVAFGKPLVHLGGNRERIADLRMAIDQARLLTLYAAWKIDTAGVSGALAEISAIKVVAANVLEQVVSEAMQMHGAAGLSQDFPLASLMATARTMRIVDGPDAVHRGVIARVELAKYGHLAQSRKDS